VHRVELELRKKRQGQRGKAVAPNKRPNDPIPWLLTVVYVADTSRLSAPFHLQQEPEVVTLRQVLNDLNRAQPK
jgi:hypothetical protein